jgi:hypothetical protein
MGFATSHSEGERRDEETVKLWNFFSLLFSLITRTTSEQAERAITSLDIKEDVGTLNCGNT